jgi:hypothetical protein
MLKIFSTDHFLEPMHQSSESRGCPRFKASEGEAVVGYREPPATKKVGYYRLSLWVNKMMKKHLMTTLLYPFYRNRFGAR